MLTPYNVAAMIEGASVKSADASGPDAALANLHAHTFDAIKVLSKLAANSNSASSGTFAQRYHDLHTRHATEIGNLLTSRGRLIVASGSFTGTMNKVLDGLRSVFDIIDGDVARKVRRVERSLLDAFDHALASGLHKEERAVIERMGIELKDLVKGTLYLK